MYGLGTNIDRFLLFLHASPPTPPLGMLGMKLNRIENVTIRSNGPEMYGLGTNIGRFRLFLHATPPQL